MPDEQIENVNAATEETQPTEAEQTEEAPDYKALYEAALADSEKHKKHSRTWEDRAKANKSAADELAQLKEAQMSEQDKAVKSAKDEARSTVLREVGSKLAQAQFETASAKAGVDFSDVLEYINVERFVTEEGEADTDAIGAAVEKFAAKVGRSAKFGDVDLGPRNTKPKSINDEIAEAQARGDMQAVLRLQNAKLFQDQD